MLKKLLIVTTVFSLVCALFAQSPITQAAKSYIDKPNPTSRLTQETGVIAAPTKVERRTSVLP